MIIMPRTGLVSARSASRTTAWYHSGKVERLPVIRLTLSARCMGNSLRGCIAAQGGRRHPRSALGLEALARAGALDHAEILRLHPFVVAQEPFRRQPAAQ